MRVDEEIFIAAEFLSWITPFHFELFFQRTISTVIICYKKIIAGIVKYYFQIPKIPRTQVLAINLWTALD